MKVLQACESRQRRNVFDRCAGYPLSAVSRRRAVPSRWPEGIHSLKTPEISAVGSYLLRTNSQECLATTPGTPLVRFCSEGCQRPIAAENDS
jgi:hypothetical protein